MDFTSIFLISLPFKKKSVLFYNVFQVKLITTRQRKKIFSKCVSRSKTSDCITAVNAFKIYCKVRFCKDGRQCSRTGDKL